MATLGSSIAIIGHPNPATISLGADFFASLEEASRASSKRPYAVTVISTQIGSSDQIHDYCENLKISSPKNLKILVNLGAPFDLLQDISNRYKIFRILKSFDNPLFERT